MMANVTSGFSRRNLDGPVAEREADADDEIGVLGLELEVGAASRGVGGSDLVDGDAEVGDGSVDAGSARVVERLVTTTQ